MFDKDFVRDLAERALWTYVFTFLTLLSASDVTDLAAWKAAALAGVAPVLSVLKNVAREYLANRPDTSVDWDHGDVPETDPEVSA